MNKKTKKIFLIFKMKKTITKKIKNMIKNIHLIIKMKKIITKILLGIWMKKAIKVIYLNIKMRLTLKKIHLNTTTQSILKKKNKLLMKTKKNNKIQKPIKTKNNFHLTTPHPFKTKKNPKNLPTIVQKPNAFSFLPGKSLSNPNSTQTLKTYTSVKTSTFVVYTV